MVLPKPKASSSAMSSPPEELRVGQVDSHESLDLSSSSAPIPRVQVIDSSEPLVPCVQVLDSNEPLVPTTTTTSLADVLVVETPESPTYTESMTSSMSPVPGCSKWDGFKGPRGVSGVMPESPTFTEQSVSPTFTEASESTPARCAPLPGCSAWDAFTAPPGVSGVMPESPTFTEELMSPTFTEASENTPAPTGSSGRRVHLYVEEIKKQWNLWKIFQTFSCVASTVSFAEERGMIPRTKMCNYHKKPMSLETSGQGPLGAFRCRKSNCRNKSVSRAKGTWFENVHLSLPLVFELMYMFTSGYSYEQVQRETSREGREEVLSTKTIADWFNYCRETICVWELEHEQERPKIGGPGKIVQIDESKFGKRKYNRGRRVEGHWVLGMIEDGSDDLRLEVCPENIRSADVLVPLIQKHVQEGSTIHTDYWRAYDCLPEYGFIHKKVNHSDPENRFVAPDGTHTQRIESHWRGLKRTFHKENFKGNFTDWLIELIWRRRIRMEKLDPFEELIKCILYVYK